MKTTPASIAEEVAQLRGGFAQQRRDLVDLRARSHHLTLEIEELKKWAATLTNVTTPSGNLKQGSEQRFMNLDELIALLQKLKTQVREDEKVRVRVNGRSLEVALDFGDEGIPEISITEI